LLFRYDFIETTPAHLGTRALNIAANFYRLSIIDANRSLSVAMRLAQSNWCEINKSTSGRQTQEMKSTQK